MASFILTLLPLLFLATFASALVQVSIDCGASSPYTDKHGIEWTIDDSYISTGESRAVKTANDSTPEPLKTLRVFDSKKKNCYSVAVKAGGSQVRVRVSFNYGNYDGKSSAPSFELMIDGNDWETVETSMDGEVNYEAVYIENGDSISVCVAQTQAGQLPFVSAIQVWELDPNMYPHLDPSTSTALVLVNRIAFGAPNTVRFPDDAYDRIWEAINIPDTLTVLKSDATSINTNISDQPPAAVLMTAITPTDPSQSIALNPGLPSDTFQIYINLYFAGTSQLSSKDTRSIALYVDGSQYSDPIIPDYASAVEYYIGNVTASSKDQFTLQATSDSTLPPIINAMEVFIVSDTLNNGTYAADVAGLASLIKQFDALKDWSGDPCLPQNYSWDWVGCSNDDTPRVTSINLNGYGLSGELPDFSSMDALQTIDLHNNSIGGAIPEFLGKLPNLKELNLADNSLSGPIPSVLSNNKKIKLEIAGNPNLCASGQSCKVIDSPADSPVNSPPGARKSHTSYATKKRSNVVGLFFLGLIVPFAFLSIEF